MSVTSVGVTQPSVAQLSVAGEVVMIEDVHRPGLAHAKEYDKAIDSLQTAGFITELWVDVKHQIITLRWVKNGAKWHVTAQGFKRISAQLEQISRNANRWYQARSRGTGKETNYAVWEK